MAGKNIIIGRVINVNRNDWGLGGNRLIHFWSCIALISAWLWL
jgi:hypothetical protein